MVAERVDRRPRLTMVRPGLQLVEVDEFDRLMQAINEAADAARRTRLNAASVWGLSPQQHAQLHGYAARLDRLWDDKRELMASRRAEAARARRRQTFRAAVGMELIG